MEITMANYVRNAKEQYLEATKGKEVLCADIKFTWQNEVSVYQLDRSYSEYRLNRFLDDLDFDYDYTFGDNLEGTIWLTDGTWLERQEYDGGNRCWVHRVCPAIPDIL